MITNVACGWLSQMLEGCSRWISECAYSQEKGGFSLFSGFSMTGAAVLLPLSSPDIMDIFMKTGLETMENINK